MNHQLLTFYYSRIIGKKIFLPTGKPVGVLLDILVDATGERPKVIAVKTRIKKKITVLDYSYFEIIKADTKYIVKCNDIVELNDFDVSKSYYIGQRVLDRQIVDIDGRKLVRVNDLRLVILKPGTFVVAADIGIEGILRRIGYAKYIKAILSIFRVTLNSKFILWDNVETVDSSKTTIKVGTQYTKLETLHPSDLADIFEEMDKTTRANVFAALNEHKAADVLEELETDAQVHLIEHLSKEKAADVLEKMRPSEAADLIDELEPQKAEELLGEMEKEASNDVRELLEYDDNEIGSLMSKDYISFNKNITVGQVIDEMRILKPDDNELYSILVTDEKQRLTATVSLRDIIISTPETPLHTIMDNQFIAVFDDDKLDDLAEIVSKYNLLAVPVIDSMSKIQGVVIIDDIVKELVENGKL